MNAHVRLRSFCGLFGLAFLAMALASGCGGASSAESAPAPAGVTETPVWQKARSLQEREALREKARAAATH